MVADWSLQAGRSPIGRCRLDGRSAEAVGGSWYDTARRGAKQAGTAVLLCQGGS